VHAIQTEQHTRPYGREVAAAITAYMVLVAGCGSSGSSKHPSASRTYAQGVKYADCMRSHGVSNFPDPNSSGGGAAQGAAPADEASPAYKSAQTACAKLRPGGKAVQVVISAGQKASIIANARCIRRHGVPNYPDPRFKPNGGVETAALGQEASSPAFIRAVRACDHTGTQVPGT
jgi:hypothetical protein